MADTPEPKHIRRGPGGLTTRTSSLTSPKQRAAADVLRRATGRGVSEPPRAGFARGAFRGGARGTAPRGRGRAGTSFASPSRAVGAAQPSEEDATAGAAGLNADGEPSPLGRVRASPRASTRMSPASRGRTGVVARSGAFSMINDILRSNEGVGQRSPRSTLPPDAEDAADEDPLTGSGFSPASALAMLPKRQLAARPQSATAARLQQRPSPARRQQAPAQNAADSAEAIDDEDEEMTPEQIEAERQAALGSMPSFGGGLKQAPRQTALPPGLQSAGVTELPGERLQVPTALLVPAGRAAGASGNEAGARTPARGPSIFGRLGATPSHAEASEQSAEAGPATVDAAAKLRRSYRFGNSLKTLPQVPGASLGSPAVQPIRFGTMSMATTGPASQLPVRAAGSEPIMGEGLDSSMGGADDEAAGIEKGTITGTCTQMCPTSEIERRIRIEDIALFEREDPRVATTTSALAVKKFARNVEQRPENFRTMEALQRTMAHLRAIMDRSDVELVNIHKFLWDRFRGVRQDLFVQGIEDTLAMSMYEEHIRFMILAEHELCEETVAAADQEAFNSHLNLEQINKALISLNSMYDKHRANGAPVPSETEFRAYHLLTLIGTHGRYGYNSSEFQNALLELSSDVLAHAEVQRVLTMQQAIESGAWVTFLRLATQAPYLQGCLAHMYFPSVRGRALTVLASTGPAMGRGSEYLLEDLQRTLQLNSIHEAAELCEAVGLEVNVMSETAATVTLPRGFKTDADKIPKRRCRAISMKAQVLRSQVAQSIQRPLDTETEARARQLAQQEAERRQQWRLAQEAEARARQLAQQQAMEAARRQADAAAEQQRAAEEVARQQAVAAQAEAARQQQLAWQQAAAEEAERVRQQQRRAAAEAAAREAERQRVLEEQRQAQARARAAAQEARRKEEARRQAELAARRAEQERLRREEEARRQRDLEWLRQRDAGLRELARKRTLRLVRRAVQRWTEKMQEARRVREEEQRLLSALKRVNVGVRARLWAPLRSSPAAETSSPASSGPSRRDQRSEVLRDIMATLHMPRLVGPVLAERNPAVGVLVWKLVLLQPPSRELDTAQEWLRSKLHVSGEADAGDAALVSTSSVILPSDTALQGKVQVVSIVHNASPALSAPSAQLQEDRAASAMAGAGVILLHVTEGDSPAAAHQRLQQLLSHEGSGVQVSLLVLSSSRTVTAEQLQEWLEGILGSDTCLAQHIGQHRVLSTPPLPSAASNALLEESLLWLAKSTPLQPRLQMTPLRDLVRQKLSIASSQLGDQAAPAAWVQAFNAQLAWAQDALQAAAGSLEARWRWPPPECAPQALEGLPQPGWYSADYQSRLQQALQAARLPDFPAAVADPGEAVERYLCGLLQVRCNAASWAVALSEAFAQRLLPLDGPEIPPAVLLPEEAPSIVPAAPRQWLPTAALAAIPKEPSSPSRKRKWAEVAEAKNEPHKACLLSPTTSLGLGPTLQPRHPLSSPAAAHQKLDDMLCNLFADAPLAASAPDRVRIEGEQRLSALQRDIEARLEANRRLAEGCFLPILPPKPTPPAAAISALEPGSAGLVSGSNASASGVKIAERSHAETELEKQRALTAFLEQAVMSW